MKKISREDLIENLNYMKEKLGRTPKKEDLRLENGSNYSINAYRREFGNLAKALLAVDIIPNQVRNATKEEIFQDLKNIALKINKTPTFKEYKKYSKINWCFLSFTNHFGSYINALKEAGLKLNGYKHITKEDVINELKIWYDQNDKDPSCLSYWSIRKSDFPFQPSIISDRFNHIPWQDIMHECGFADYITTDQFIKRGSYLGKDGQTYLSLIELRSANVLFRLKNLGTILSYKYEAQVCPERQWTCDFKIDLQNNNIIWLEIDGMREGRGVPYGSGLNEKINYYVFGDFDYEIVSYDTENIEDEIIKIISNYL